MAIYSDYLGKLSSFPAIQMERKKQLGLIAEKRGREVLTIASDLGGSPGKAGAPTGIDYTDLLPVRDLLDTFSGDRIDVILESPGGFAECAEDIVRMIRGKFKDVAFIVPGAAKSAGTIMVMSGDEILLEPSSSLGPIDAQVSASGKRFSAEAFLEGLEQIKKEVEKKDSLNRAYIPILQGISPGEIQTCQNAQDYSRKLVREWLAKWKFRNWSKHASTGKRVTESEKKRRAASIARRLCSHSHWLTHGRSIKMDDLREMRLLITDYTEEPDLCDAIRRYYTLLRMGFEASTMYKVFETPEKQIARFLAPTGPPPTQSGASEVAMVDFKCPRCATASKLQANLGKKSPLQEGCLPFPGDNRFECPNCGLVAPLGDVRKRIEAQGKKPIVS